MSDNCDLKYKWGVKMVDSKFSGRFLEGEDIHFIRYIGARDEKKYLETILEMDLKLGGRRNGKQMSYMRLSSLESRMSIEEIEQYSKMYEEWCGYQDKPGAARSMPQAENSENTINTAFQRVLELYRNSGAHINDSMVKNFAVKLLYWTDLYFPGLTENHLKINGFCKIVFTGAIKVQEYLFLYLMVLLGKDVLYLNPKEDISFAHCLKELSSVYTEKKVFDIEIPVQAQEEVQTQEQIQTQDTGAEGKVIISRDKIKRERRPAPAGSKKNAEAVSQKNRVTASQKNAVAASQPMEYEELAKLASSVVMITVYDRDGKCFKSGSGVIISESGYILTNFHVVYGGACYGIRLEEEESVFETDELVKYNQLYDLAVLKMERRLKPIPIYRQKDNLVRGQKVVAIGSPLGLFNSVSDGIIAGFRILDETSMIQFTAPTSHGSSGGALLNLYGELIGIITAGFDDGQNLNLAVDSSTVLGFVKGFL